MTEPLDVDIVQLARGNDAFRPGHAPGTVHQTRAKADAAEAAGH